MDMFSSRTVFFMMSACLVAGQRPSFAGLRPIGFPELQNKTSGDDLGNRFGDDGLPLPLPIEAKGDRDLVNRISKLPLDKQPFWYINWKALEENRRNPQTYEQRPNVFVDPSSNTAFNTNVNNQSNNDLTSKFGTVTNQPQTQQTQAETQQTLAQTQNYTNKKFGHRRSYRGI